MEENIIVQIEKQDHQGRGIAHVNGKITFVPKALPDEIVNIKLCSKFSKFNEGQIITINKSSSCRTKVICKHYSICGGCQLLHQKYEAQLDFKQQKIKDILTKYAKTKLPTINPIIKSEPFYYRNKVTLHIIDNKIGYYSPRTHEIVDITTCYLLNPLILKIINKLKAFIKQHQGLEKAMIRIGNGTDEIMLNLKGTVPLEYIQTFFTDQVTSLIYNNKVLLGKSSILVKLNKYNFYVSAPAFFQVNVFTTDILYQTIINMIKDIAAENVLDLYCGTGTIGICISPYVNKIIGIEVTPEAVDNAKENQRLNNIKNIDFMVGKVEEVLPQISSVIDTIIVDPPRNGLHQSVIKKLIDMSVQNIIYTSCDPMTLARDIALLKDNYQLLIVQPIDMFPNTYHMECVCLLKRIK